MTAMCACSDDTANVDSRYLAVRTVDDERWSILDSETGKVLFYSRFPKRPSAVCADMFVAENIDGFFRCYSVSREDKPVCDERFTQLGSFNGSNVTFAVKECGPIMILDKRFNTIRQLPTNVSRVRSFSCSRAAFCRDGKWGYLDPNGREVIKAEFAESSDFGEGRAFVQKGDGVCLIDDDGDVLRRWPLGAVVPLSKYKDGYADVLLCGRKTRLDRNGNEEQSVPATKTFELSPAVAKKYVEVRCLTQEPVRFMAFDGKEWTLIDETGMPVSSFRFAEIGPADDVEDSFYSESSEVE